MCSLKYIMDNLILALIYMGKPIGTQRPNHILNDAAVLKSWKSKTDVAFTTQSDLSVHLNDNVHLICRVL